MEDDVNDAQRYVVEIQDAGKPADVTGDR